MHVAGLPGRCGKPAQVIDVAVAHEERLGPASAVGGQRPMSRATRQPGSSTQVSNPATDTDAHVDVPAEVGPSWP